MSVVRSWFPIKRLLGPRAETVDRIDQGLSDLGKRVVKLESRIETLQTDARDVRLGLAALGEAVVEAQKAGESRGKASDQRAKHIDKVVTHTDEGIGAILKCIFQLDKRLVGLDDGLAAARTEIRHVDKRIDFETGMASTNVRLAEIEDQFSQFHRRLQMVLRRHDARRDGPRSESEGAFLIAATQVIETQRTLLGYDRLQTLWQAAQNAAALDLPVAEVGTYRGGSAHFLAQAFREAGRPNVPIHAFDTFTGHPPAKITPIDEEHSAEGLFVDVTAEDVRAFLAEFETIHVHEGEFAEMAPSVANLRFSLVHVDVDTYASTMDCLAFFTPRVPAGGIVIVDDFRSDKCPGVAQAIAEFSELESSYQVWDVNTEQLVLVRR